ncbi:DUF1294 domain-containing protein [Adlercreutzia sp. ZJ138]|uniref:DUF1294 domain-containing protein n=1 Tax=Adlercreutzia sp. ZJ138 TaxID=2709405 RepID=UPI0013ECAC9C|nr:DUF1294 domain-containing protein [Adlercreutzia sp. ZJ138]
MDPFLQYLIVINVVAFVAFAIDFFLCMRIPTLDDSAANSLIVCVFPIAGGAVGALIALFIFTGLISRHRMNKDNIAWWFLSIVCLVVWGLFVAVRYGLVTLDAGIGGIFAGWDMVKLRLLGIYLVLINVVTFIFFAWDKHVAKSDNDHRRRTPEARLLGLCLIGGSVGGLIAMRAVRHKTKKWYFVLGLPFFIVLDVVVVVYAHMAGLI